MSNGAARPWPAPSGGGGADGRADGRVAPGGLPWDGDAADVDADPAARADADPDEARIDQDGIADDKPADRPSGPTALGLIIAAAGG